MRTLSVAVLLAAASLGGVLASPNGAVGTVMIFVDDLRAEIGGPYGLDGTVKTPNLDRLASWGRTFRHAYTSIAICSPSRWATISGLRPDTSRVWYIGPYLRDTFAEGPNATTMPQAFKEAGIEMVQGAGKTLHPGSSSGGPSSSIGGADSPYSFKYDNQTTTHGYFWCDQFYNGTVQSPRSTYWPNGTGCIQSDECIACLAAHDSLGGPTFKPSWRGAPCPASCYPDGAVADEASRLLRDAATIVDKAADSDEQSFFLAFGLKRPHLGWYAPQWAFDEYAPNGSIPLAPHRQPPQDMPEVAFYDNGEMIGMQDVTTALVNDTSGYPLIVDWKQHELRRAYYASVTFMDSQLGAILDTIEELNLRDRINMAFVGDHGYGLGEHGEWCKQSNFETTTRVPLFFAGPGISPGSVDSASLVEMLDIAPTLTDLAGITVPFKTPGTRWQGASLADLLLAPPPTTAPSGFDAAFSQFPRVYKPSATDAVTAELVATAYAAGIGALPAARFEGDAGVDADWDTIVEILRLGAAGNTMGLSMRTPLWRYTEWRPFNFSSAEVDWTQTHGTELYNHSTDTGSGPGVFDDFENVNLAPNPQYASTVQQLSQKLRAAWDNPAFKAHQAEASK